MKEIFKDGKSLIIVVLLVSLLVMSVGYAAFAQTLNINGDATITGEWDVEIISIEPVYTGFASDTEDNPIFTSTTAIFDTILTQPGDAATYTITVKNKGTLDAKLNSITLVPEETGSPAIIYNVVSKPEEGSVLAAGATTTVVIKVEYDSTVEEVPENTTKKITGVLNYVQNTK